MFSPSQELFGESSGLTLIRAPWFQKYHGSLYQKTKRGEWYNVLASFRAPKIKATPTLIRPAYKQLIKL